MNYYYFNAIYFDARHQLDYEIPICIVAEAADEAVERARKETHEFENKYPYKILIELNLEQTIPAATMARLFKGGDDYAGKTY